MPQEGRSPYWLVRYSPLFSAIFRYFSGQGSGQGNGHGSGFAVSAETRNCVLTRPERTLKKIMRRAGLEPAWIAPHAPQTCAYTISATCALQFHIYTTFLSSQISTACGPHAYHHRSLNNARGPWHPVYQHMLRNKAKKPAIYFLLK